MKITPIYTPLPGEHVAGVEPTLSPNVQTHWNRRLNLYTGRALSDAALTLEQDGRAGRLATRGQMASHGVVSGFEVGLEHERDGTDGQARHFYQIAAGMGIAASGEDVILRRTLRVNVRDIQVCGPPALFPPYDTTSSNGSTPHGSALVSADDEDGATTVDHQVGSWTLGELIDYRATHVVPPSAAALPRVGLLLLQPVVSELIDRADASDPCEEDPENYAFDDFQLVDGCRLLWYVWPAEWRALPPLDRQRRNVIANTIFEAEARLGPEGLLPWERIGVPIGVVGFNRHWEPLFVDRSAVVRAGGRPPRRSVILPKLGNPFLWQARIQQFTEQTADDSLQASTPTQLARRFRFLPPAGVLPRSAVDLDTRTSDFLPSTYRVDAAPIPLEQLDAAMEESAPLARYDLFVPDDVQVLVPVPQAWFEPGLLRRETVSPAFLETIDALVRRRGKWLRRRLEVRHRKAVIDRAIGSLEETYPDRDPDALDDHEAISDTTIDATDPQLAQPEEQFGTSADGVDLVSTVLQQLREYLVNETPLYDDVSTAFLSPANPIAVTLATSPVSAVQIEAASGNKVTYDAVKHQLLFDPRAEALTPEEAAALKALSTDVAYNQALTALLTRFTSDDTTLVFPTLLRGKVTYDRTRRQLVYTARPEPMTPDEQQRLHALSPDRRWIKAVDTLFTFSHPNAPVRIPLAHAPRVATRQHLAALTNNKVLYDGVAHQLIYTGRPAPISREMLLALTRLSSNSEWVAAVKAMYTASLRPATPTNAAALVSLPVARTVLFDVMGGRVVYDDLTRQLIFTGRPAAMTAEERDALKQMKQGARFDTAVDALFTRSQQNEVAQLDRLGLRNFIAYLERKIGEADDKVDLSFTRVQTDIYRVRQLMLGTNAATRLATSPVLASIAQGDSAVASHENIQAFVSEMKQPPPGVGPLKSQYEPPTIPPPTVSSTGPVTRTPTSMLGLRAAASPSMASARLVTSTVEAQIVPAIRQTTAEVFTAASLATPVPMASAQATALPLAGAKTADVVGQTSLIGKALNFRTVTLAERLEQPKAPEAKNAAVATKAGVISEVIGLAINTADLVIPGFNLYNNSATLVVDRYVMNQDRVQRVVPREMKYTIQEVAERGLVTEVLAGYHDLDPLDGDESAFFAMAVRALDHAVAILRVAEGRIQAYRTALDRCRRALSDLEALRARVDARLGVIGGELSETRHDVAVSRALLADETARIAAINERRQRILADHVPYLAFRRPRAADLLAGVPTRHVDPAATEAPIATCMAREVTVPRELQQMANLLRDVPVRWLAYLSPMVDRLDRLDTLHQTLAFAKVRAEALQPARMLAAAPTVPLMGVGLSIQQVFGAHQDVVALQRQTTARLDLAEVVGQSWLNVAERARDLLSLGDLTDADHGRADVSRAAAQEIEQIAHVAACFYESVGAVLPALRLEWTELLSQYDAPVSLRNLASLPKWGTIELLDRREMQGMVDWLYGRVASDQPQAVAFMDDLVRLCILVASHAPVNAIIAGNVQQNAPVQRGGRVDVAVDLARVHVGMQVFMYADTSTGPTVVARGVVEDLGAGKAATRVVDVASPTVNVSPATRVQFMEPAQAPITTPAARAASPATLLAGHLLV